MLRQGFTLATAVLVVGLFVVGCGGGDNDSGADANGATAATDGESGNSGDSASGGEARPAEMSSEKKAFVEKANAICELSLRQLVRQLRDASRGNGGANTHAAQVEFVSTDLPPVLEQEIEEIRALGIPSGDEDEVNAFLEEVEELIGQAGSDPESFVAGEDPYAESSELASEYGIYACPLSSGLS